MNVQELTVDREEARAKLRAYRSRRHRDAEAEYRAAERLYEAAAAGERLIVAGDSILETGFNDRGQPHLAIARADRKQVCCFRHDRTLIFDGRADPDRFNRRHPNLIHSYQIRRDQQAKHWERWYATVPMVPADVRPEKGQLKDWHILWEVDRWHDRPIIDPPYDPILLRQIEGDVFAIIAEWDLTELEREAMRLSLR